MLVFSMLLAIAGEPERWQVGEVITTLRGDQGQQFAPPVTLVQDRDRLLVLDAAYRLWFLTTGGQVRAIAGGRGSGPGQLDPVYRNLFFDDDKIRLIHDSGRQIETYSRSGDHMSSENPRQLGLTYRDERGHSLLLRGDHPRDAASITLVWKNANGREEVPLMSADAEDRCPWLYCLTARSGDFLLLATPLSLKRTIHYALLNWRESQIWDLGQIELEDPRQTPPQLLEAALKNENTSIPVLAGLTTSREHGFVLTESTEPGRFRILRLFEPGERSWRTIRVETAPFDDLSHFQHLDGNRWAAFQPGSLVVFEMKTDP